MLSDGSASSLLTAEGCSPADEQRGRFAQASVRGHFGRFHASAAVSDAVVNIAVRVSLWRFSGFPGKYLEEGLPFPWQFCP